MSLRKKFTISFTGLALVSIGFTGGWLTHEPSNQPQALQRLTPAQAICLNSAGTAPGCTITAHLAPHSDKITPWTAK